MAFVRVEQRHAHLASAVRLEYVNGRDGKIAKGTVTAISNIRRGAAEERDDETTAIQWTLWGKQAENAATYLGKGSHVNIVGRLRNDRYEKDGETVYALSFTSEEIDYLDSRRDAEERRARLNGGAASEAADAGDAGEAGASSAAPAGKAAPRGRAARTPAFAGA